MNTENTPVQTSKPDSLYLRTKITRGDITIFKRYEGEDAAYYFRPTTKTGRRKWKLLRTADESFKKARQILDALDDGRFDALDKIRCRTTNYATLGELFARYQSHARFISGIQQATVTGAIRALRNIIRKTSTTATPLTDEAIDKQSTSILTRELLEAYKQTMLSAAGVDHLKQRTASVTANSTLRQARSIFAKKLGPDFYQGLVLPDLSKFMSVQFFRVEKRRYKLPEAEMIQKIRTHANLLKQTDKSAYMVYLLGMGSGLRKGEIGHARIRWIQRTPGISNAKIHIQTEADFHIKDNEARTVPIDDFVLAELDQHIADRGTPGAPAAPDQYILAGHATERTDKVFRRVGTWLKSLGWDRRLKTHEFRKLFGSMACQQAGVRAAQVLLGHANVTTTEDIYVDPAASIVKIEIFRPEKVA